MIREVMAIRRPKWWAISLLLAVITLMLAFAPTMALAVNPGPPNAGLNHIPWVGVR